MSARLAYVGLGALGRQVLRDLLEQPPGLHNLTTLPGAPCARWDG